MAGVPQCIRKAGSGLGDPVEPAFLKTGPVSPVAGPSYKARLAFQCMYSPRRRPWGELPMELQAERPVSGYYFVGV